MQRLHDAAPVRALLYTGSVENPNFWWGDDGSGWDLNRAAEIIASSVGPSGSNIDYLRNLVSFLEAEGHVDLHVSNLLQKVKDIQNE